MSEMCAECGDDKGVVNHVDIAWPNGRHVALWLHRDCEADCIKRLEEQHVTDDAQAAR